MTVVNVSKLWKEPRCGTVRAGMKTNCLLAKSDLGKVNRSGDISCELPRYIIENKPA